MLGVNALKLYVDLRKELQKQVAYTMVHTY